MQQLRSTPGKRWDFVSSNLICCTNALVHWAFFSVPGGAGAVHLLPVPFQRNHPPKAVEISIYLGGKKYVRF